MISDETVHNIVRRAVSAGRSRLSREKKQVLSLGTTLIEDNNLPDHLLGRRRLSSISLDEQNFGFVYSFPWYMAALREPGHRRQRRLIPTPAGLHSASARLVYRIPYGVIAGVTREMDELYERELMDTIEKDIRSHGNTQR